MELDLFRDWTPCDPIGRCAVRDHNTKFCLFFSSFGQFTLVRCRKNQDTVTFLYRVTLSFDHKYFQFKNAVVHVKVNLSVFFATQSLPIKNLIILFIWQRDQTQTCLDQYSYLKRDVEPKKIEIFLSFDVARAR